MNQNTEVDRMRFMAARGIIYDSEHVLNELTTALAAGKLGWVQYKKWLVWIYQVRYPVF